MSDTKRYCIEEEGTSGWTQVEANASNLTKEDCDIMLQRSRRWTNIQHGGQNGCRFRSVDAGAVGEFGVKS